MTAHPLFSSCSPCKLSGEQDKDQDREERGKSGSGIVADDLVHVPPAFETLPAHPIRGASPPQFCVIFSVSHPLLDIY